jgi:hypothetical protein
VPHEQVAPETEGVVIGNHTHKYTARNPANRWLTQPWVANLERVFQQLTPTPAPPARPGPQAGVGQVQGDHLAPAALHPVGDHALAAADLPLAPLPSAAVCARQRARAAVWGRAL